MDTIKKDQKRNFSNTISAGLKSLSGKGRTFYVIEFKTNTQLHRSNTSKEMIVDYVEIGRSPKCQIRFGEDCRLVSGVHCAIVREDENYFIKHLSKTNPTLINGQPVADKYYLNTGDELQLSYGGPILGFMIPVNNLTSSIPLTRRLGLFKEQAMRPYKRAIAALSFVLLLCIAGFAAYIIKKDKEHEIVIARIDKVIAEEKQKLENAQKVNDSLWRVKAISEGTYTTRTSALTSQINSLTNQLSSVNVPSLFPSVYYIRVVEIKAEINGKLQTIDDANGWSGTGFLLSDGRFVTARHVIENWFYSKDDLGLNLNEIATDGGKVIAYFKAWSSSGNEIAFTSEQFIFDKSRDKKETLRDTINNSDHYYTQVSYVDDWTYGKNEQKGNLSIDSKLSTSLPVGTQLFTLGFPLGIGAEDRKDLEPMYSPFVVSSSGTSNGTISISSKSFDHGNSGGPVFVKKGNQYKVIGIISMGLGSQGFIIPIAKIK